MLSGASFQCQGAGTFDHAEPQVRRPDCSPSVEEDPQVDRGEGSADATQASQLALLFFHGQRNYNVE